MEETDTRRIQPAGRGPHWTHYNVTKSRLTDRKTYDPAQATSIIDLVCAHADTLSDGIIRQFRLKNDTHVNADHVGLELKLRTTTANKGMLTPIKGKQAKKPITLKPDTVTQKQYTRASAAIIPVWLQETEAERMDWTREEAITSIKTLIATLKETRDALTGETVPKQYRAKQARKDKQRTNLNKAMQEAIKAF
jgi:hypothetical protein